MQLSEQVVFKWVVIVLIAAASVALLKVLAGSLVGALWLLVLACVGSWYGYRWSVRKWRGS